MPKACYPFVIVALLVAGCDVNKPPPATLVDHTTVVTIGAEAPTKGEYILYVPAGRSIPVHLSVTGSFLNKQAVVDTDIEVQNDLYIYKQWSSFDGRHWQPSDELFDTRLRAGLTQSGAKVDVEFNRAAEAQ
jgi:hypothetical protein